MWVWVCECVRTRAFVHASVRAYVRVREIESVRARACLFVYVYVWYVWERVHSPIRGGWGGYYLPVFCLLVCLFFVFISFLFVCFVLLTTLSSVHMMHMRCCCSQTTNESFNGVSEHQLRFIVLQNNLAVYPALAQKRET